MESKTSARRLNVTERREEAWELRLAGHSLAHIAQKLGVSVAQTSRDVAAKYEEYRQHYAESAHQAATYDLNRLDRLIKAHWDEALTDPKTAAVVLKMLAQRERIYGYAAPTKTQVDVQVPVPQALQETEQALLQRIQQVGVN